MKIKPVIGRVGGKARLAPWILEFIKQHQFSIYCEPFCGNSAVYFALLNDRIPEEIKARGRHFRAVLNDADKEIMSLYRTVRDYPEILAYSVYFTPYSRAEHKEAQQRGTGDRIEEARRYLVDGWQSYTQDLGHGWGVKKETLVDCREDGKRKGGGHGGVSPEGWNTLPSRILTASPHLQQDLDALKKVYLECDDAIKCIERWATPETLFYVDPPYVSCENYYAHNAKQGKDYNLELHYRLAECLNQIECAGAIVSYYPDDLLDELYPEKHWDRHYKETVASSAGITRQSKSKKRPKRTELLLVRKNRNEGTVRVAMSGQLKFL